MTDEADVAITERRTGVGDERERGDRRCRGPERAEGAIRTKGRAWATFRLRRSERWEPSRLRVAATRTPREHYGIREERTRSDCWKNAGASRHRGVAGCPRWNGEGETETRPRGKTFPRKLKFTIHPQQAEHHLLIRPSKRVLADRLVGAGRELRNPCASGSFNHTQLGRVS